MRKKTSQGVLIFVLSGPSGSGKTTVTDSVIKELGIKRSISDTTRKPRAGEVNGKDYNFLSRDEFLSRARSGHYFEHAEYLGNLYGTPCAQVHEHLAAGEPIILDIDVQGAAQVKKLCPGAVLIFLMPPDEEALRSRLANRRTDSPGEVGKRLERAHQEMTQRDKYDYTVINGDLRTAVQEVKDIIAKEVSR